MFDPYDKSDREKAEAIAKGIPGDGTCCPKCNISFARWLLGMECEENPHSWHQGKPCNAADFIRDWFQKKWGVAPALLGFPEMKPNLSVGEMAELMEAYKKAGTCKFCDCPYPM